MARTTQELQRLLAAEAGRRSGYGLLNEDGQPTNPAMALSIAQKLQEAGEDPSLFEQGTNILGRGLDLLQRPLYAVENVLDDYIDRSTERAEEAKQEGKGYFDRLGGSIVELGESLVHPGQLWQGLSGQQKITTGDLIDKLQHNSGTTLPGPVQGGLGFVGDVVFDPLTYAGPGIFKRVAESTLDTAGLNAADRISSEIMQEGLERGSTGLSLEATRRARRVLREEGITPKAGKSQAEIARRAQEVREAFVEERALDQGVEAANRLREQLLAESPGTIGLRVGSRAVGPQSEALYNAGSRIASRIGRTGVATDLNRMFRPAASSFKGGANRLLRRAFSSSASASDEFLRTIRKGGIITDDNGLEISLPSFNDLSARDADAIGSSLQSNVAPPGLEGYHSAARSVFDAIHADAVGTHALGIEDLSIRQIDDYVDDYAPVIFKKGSGKEIEEKAFDKARNAEYKLNKEKINIEADKRGKSAVYKAKKEGITDPEEINAIYNDAARKFAETQKNTTKYTVDYAKAQGLDPVTDVRDMIAHEIWEHFGKTARVKFANDIATQFGVRLQGTGAKAAQRLGMVPIKSKYLPDDVFAPKEIADSFGHLDGVFHGDDMAGQGLLDLYDKALGQLKFFQTVANPGHHVRNVMTDITNSFLDGVTSPVPYYNATRLIRGTKGGETILGPNFENIIEGLDDIKIQFGGKELDGNQVMSLFTETGSRSGMLRTEILTKSGTLKDTVRAVAETREDWARLAHFIDAFQKEAKHLGPDADYSLFKEAAERAGDRVRKFNIDYGDLTPFEQKVMKRIIPFYTFMRKNTPLQIEALLMKPGRASIAPKFVRNLQNSLGQNDEEGNMWGINSLPTYIQQMMGVKAWGEEGSAEGTYWDPKGLFSVFDLNELLGEGVGPLGAIPNPRDVAEAQLAGMTLPLQAPLEQLTGYNFFTGRPSDTSLFQKGAESTPIGRIAYEQFGPIPEQDNGERAGLSRRLINLFTGAGFQEVNEGSVRGELRRQEDIIDALLRDRRKQLQEALLAQQQNQGYG